MTHPPPGHRLYAGLACLFCAAVVIANTISAKAILLGPIAVPAGMIVFPIAYINGDVLAEVYGYRRTRTVIYFGAATLALMMVFYQLAGVLPSAPFYTDNEAFLRVLGVVPRISAASLAAYIAGELINAYIMAWMKVRTDGKWFALRAAVSTFAGQGADSFLFITLAFAGVYSPVTLLWMALSGWAFKSAYEVAVLPVTCRVVSYVKHVEGIDVYGVGD